MALIKSNKMETFSPSSITFDTPTTQTGSVNFTVPSGNVCIRLRGNTGDGYVLNVLGESITYTIGQGNPPTNFDNPFTTYFVFNGNGGSITGNANGYVDVFPFTLN